MPVALGAMVAPVSPRAPARPRGLIALGVLCIVFGVLGLLVGAARLAVGAVQTHVLRSGDQVLIIEQPDWARYWMIGDAVLAGGLVLSGIGLLTLKPWSRPMGVVIGALQVLSSLAAAGMIVATMSNQPETSGPGSTTVIAVNVGAILFKLLTAVFPAIVVLVLARRSSADALRQP